MDEYTRGFREWQEENEQKAVEIFRRGYEKGDARCAFGLLLAAEKAKTVCEEDYARLGRETVTLRQRAPDDPVAAMIIGYCLERGIGIPADEESALWYYRLAAKAGIPYAADRVVALRQRMVLRLDGAE